MGTDEVLITYVNKKHKSHEDIIEDILSKGFQYHEMPLPQEVGECSIDQEVKSRVDECNVLVVYISKEGKVNPCLTQAVSYAKERNKRIISLWVEDNAEVGDMNGALERHSDCVIIYNGDFSTLLDEEDEVWVKPNGDGFSDREIKHHKCG